MGGKHDYFGLWLDAEFGKGKSSPSCTTFACPQLTDLEDFSIQHMEVWGVGPEPTKEEVSQFTEEFKNFNFLILQFHVELLQNVRVEKSILDKDPEAQAMLEMIDRGRKSDGYREPPKED